MNVVVEDDRVDPLLPDQFRQFEPGGDFRQGQSQQESQEGLGPPGQQRPGRTEEPGNRNILARLFPRIEKDNGHAQGADPGDVRA